MFFAGVPSETVKQASRERISSASAPVITFSDLPNPYLGFSVGLKGVCPDAMRAEEPVIVKGVTALSA
jgi:hypothetical protein